MRLIFSILFAFSAHGATLGWSPNAASDGVLYYSLYRFGGSNWLYIAMTTNTSIPVPSVAPGTHVFAVTASNTLESDRSNSLTVRVAQVTMTLETATSMATNSIWARLASLTNTVVTTGQMFFRARGDIR